MVVHKNQIKTWNLIGGIMRVLIGCEFSGIVREEFNKLGFDAWSCDLLPTDIPGKHLQCDIFDAVELLKPDLLIAHPPCTHLAVSGAKHFARKIADGSQQQGIDFFMRIARLDIKMMCIENPVGIMSRIYRKPDQIINPFQFGHNVSKKTCLWLYGLKPLVPTNIVDRGEYITFPSGKRMHKWYADKPFGGTQRQKIRDKTFQGIAQAMANQWGNGSRDQDLAIMTLQT